MPNKKSKKKAAPLPKIVKKEVTKKVTNPLIESKPRKFGIGQAIQPKRDLTHFMKWPKYVTLQRQSSTLKRRLKIPPPINQFRRSLDKDNAVSMLKLLEKNRGMTPQERRIQLKTLAAERTSGKTVQTPKRTRHLFAGVREVTQLIQHGRAQLVVIAHDVEPLTIVLHLPHMCKRYNVPYVIIKGKARLGGVVRRKTCSVLALGNVRSEDKSALSKMQEVAKSSYNDRADEIRRSWGGGEVSSKSAIHQAKILRKKLKE
jgi:large subunit ribosomal protein L7Ae